MMNQNFVIFRPLITSFDYIILLLDALYLASCNFFASAASMT